nr:E3 ubiquitin-protein ligase BRE1-like 2 isoform X3 [Tanacetum cinerariifolium]
MKIESLDALKSSNDNPDSTIESLEQQLQQIINENNELEIRMEEAVQDSERKDIKAEFQVMASALSKEMEMMKSQLNRWKDTGSEAVSLKEAAQSLRALVDQKTSEHKDLVDNCSEQSAEIKSLQAHIERLQKGKLESQIFLDMLGQRLYDNRDIMEIKESERRAHSQAERLADAEAEIADLMAQLDASDRDVLELSEAIKIKDGEAESYISEIETIVNLENSKSELSNADKELKCLKSLLSSSEKEHDHIGRKMEEIQEELDNERKKLDEELAELNMKVSELTLGSSEAAIQKLQDEIKECKSILKCGVCFDRPKELVSESVKMKQSHTSLLSEKQTLDKQLHQVNAAVESLKSRIVQSEEQMNACVTHALKSTEEDRHLAVNLENSKSELSNADKELKCLKSLLSSSEKEHDHIGRKMEEIQEELDNERNDRKKLDEELAELNMKVSELTLGSSEAAIQKLQDEIKECKSILKCGVCFDRPKEVVIVKCFHLFCNPCIQRNLEIRHRKCPGCGMAFGQNDVRFVKI